MRDIVRAAARLIELASIPWEEQSRKVKAELSKLRTGRANEYARALIEAHEKLADLCAAMEVEPRLVLTPWAEIEKETPK